MVVADMSGFHVTDVADVAPLRLLSLSGARVLHCIPRVHPRSSHFHQKKVHIFAQGSSSACHIRPGPSQASAHHRHPRPRGAISTAASSTWPYARTSATQSLNQSDAPSNSWPVYTGDADPHAPVLDPRLSAADRAVLALAKAASSLSDREKVGHNAQPDARHHQQQTAPIRALWRATASKSCR